MAAAEIDGSNAGNTVVEGPERIVSVDVLRGFDMFWLIGGTGFVMSVTRFLPEGLKGILLPQFEHVEWEGFHFYDLIFPLFVFVVGMSAVFSLGKLIEAKGARAAYRRIGRRVALMFLLGVFYYGGLSNPVSNIRWLGVLQRLALCYLFASLLYCHVSWKGLAGVCIGILAGYWFLLSFVPVPGREGISFALQENWPNYIDSLLLPGRRYDGVWDPEGILSTLPAIATCLLGVLSAQFLQHPKIRPGRKVMGFLGAGVVLVVLGYAWGFQFPIIKKLWTSSFVLVAGGYSVLLLGLFYLVVDVLKIRWWITPFIWIGMNPLTIYLARNVMDFNKLSERFVGGSVGAATGEDGAYFLMTGVSLALSVLLVRFLYQKRIFLRL